MTEATAEVRELGGRSEGRDEFGAGTFAEPVTAPARRAAQGGRREQGVNTTVREQLEYVANMRQLGRRFLIDFPVVTVEALVWRLVAAVAIAAGVAACGLLLTVLAFFGTPLRPNPYIALTVFLVGVALCATVATAVHGERPRIRRR